MRFNFQFPWWLKIFSKIVLSNLPFTYFFWRKIGIFRHGKMDNDNYALDIFNMHMRRSNLEGNLVGKTIIELGPGDSISTAIIAASYGAKSILVDVGIFISKDITRYRKLANMLKQKGLLSPDLSNVKSIAEILNICDAKYLTAGLHSIEQLNSNSIDIIFSQAVLEHIRLGDFRNMMEQCQRILKTKGICSHQVDLRDHLGGALNNLRFDKKTWESNLFVNSGFYTNRIRYHQMLELFKDTGFQIESAEVIKWSDLPTQRKRMSTEFRLIPIDELLVSIFDVILTKNTTDKP